MPYCIFYEENVDLHTSRALHGPTTSNIQTPYRHLLRIPLKASPARLNIHPTTPTSPSPSPAAKPPNLQFTFQTSAAQNVTDIHLQDPPDLRNPTNPTPTQPPSQQPRPERRLHPPVDSTTSARHTEEFLRRRHTGRAAAHPVRARREPDPMGDTRRARGLGGRRGGFLPASV
jgi:hypothetical protein